MQVLCLYSSSKLPEMKRDLFRSGSVEVRFAKSSSEVQLQVGVEKTISRRLHDPSRAPSPADMIALLMPQIRVE